jgi:hypothetical protein
MVGGYRRFRIIFSCKLERQNIQEKSYRLKRATSPILFNRNDMGKSIVVLGTKGVITFCYLMGQFLVLPNVAPEIDRLFSTSNRASFDVVQTRRNSA